MHEPVVWQACCAMLEFTVMIMLASVEHFMTVLMLLQTHREHLCKRDHANAPTAHHPVLF